jgi:ribosomal protein L12E/L44/L45/RPP1/RPP2
MKINELIENFSGAFATVATPLGAPAPAKKAKKAKKETYGNDAAKLEDVSSLIQRR